MKLGRIVELRVFSKENEDADKIKEKLESLVPFDMAEEKVKLNKQTAQGFNERKIIIFTIVLKKDRHINIFIKKLFSKLAQEQREMIKNQIDSRIDDELNFFLRLDKQKLLDDNVFFVTDDGNCFHVRIGIAAYPAKKEAAKKFVLEMFDKYTK